MGDRRSAAGRISRVVLVLAVLSAALGLGSVTPARADIPDRACGTPLDSAEIASIVRLSDTSTLAGSSLDRLETAVERHRQIVAILVEHRDRRGVFAIGLDAVEQAAVMPLQRDPASFDDPEFAHRISLELLSRFLDTLHTEFTGAPTPPQWAAYFALTRQCDISPARVAMAGYNAHLTVDLAYSVAAVRATTANAADHFRIVDAIARSGDLIVALTRDVYGGDLGPLWRFYFLGEGLDAVFGAGVGSEYLLRLADTGANVLIFGNGLALQDPALTAATAAEIDALWRAVDAALEVLTRVGGL